MDATLNLYAKLLAFSDKTVNSNPRLRSVDWEREAGGISVKDPDSRGYEVLVGASKLVFDGTRSTTIDGSTAFSIALLNTNASTYRITTTGGTAPGFRTGRSLTLNTCVVSFAVGSNNVVALSVTGSSDFTNVQVGDALFVPHTTTGDAANVISTLNAGYWLVVAKASATSLSIVRDGMETFEGVSETVTLTSSSQLVAYGSSGVQLGDTVTISAGFSVGTRSSFEVSAVTNTFIEFVSTLGLPDETGITPGATGMSFYTDSKRLLYIETDQECVLRLNGDSGDYNRLSPIEAGNPDLPGIFIKWGAVYSLTIVNKSTSTLNVLVITAE